jgi:tRNA-dihydrouridine synthase B
MSQLPYPKGSLLFAPMEGVTDEAYRQVIQHICPEWDYLCTDFYRVPTVGRISLDPILNHYGQKTLTDLRVRQKTGFQILTAAQAQTQDVARACNEIGLHHLDLNLGCPARRVNAHQGGSYMLQDLALMEKTVRLIRAEFKQVFTAKIRLGYHDTKQFEEIVMRLVDSGVEAITIHGRTRDQMYQGKADWDAIARAVEFSPVPIIGNGDLWNVEDIDAMFKHTGCYAVMLGRGALKTPWIARLYKEFKNRRHELHETFLHYERLRSIDEYFNQLQKMYEAYGYPKTAILGRFKSLSRYLFDDFEQAQKVRSNFLRSMSLEQFHSHLELLR